MTKKPFRSIHGLLVVTCVFLSLGWNKPSGAINVNAPQQKPATVRLQTTLDGFTGTCDAESEMAQLEAHWLYDGSSISSIRHSDGRVLVETVLKGNNLEFRFPNVKLAMDLGNQTLIGT